jgi:tetratricopeptide (TPR) repeat protein
MLHEAISLFQASGSGLNDPMADYNLGNCYSELNQFQEAVYYYDKSLSADLESRQAAQIWTNRGNTVDRIGDTQDAIQSFKNAIELDLSLWNAHASWAALEVRRGNFQMACQHFRDAFNYNDQLQFSGDNIVYWFAYSLYKTGEFRESLTTINHLLAADPLHKEGLQLKSHLLSELRQDDDSYTTESLTFFKSRFLDEPTDLLALDELNQRSSGESRR